jgi:o-succinylbenzoate---CoA ligase
MITISNKEHWLIEQAKFSSEKTAVFYESNHHSYDNILSLSKQAANYFLEKGVAKFDHVSIISGNNSDFIIAINGLWLIGAVPIPLNVRLNYNEINKLLQHSQSKFLVNIGEELEHTILDFCQVINFHKYSVANNEESTGVIEYDPNSIALLMYTSGTTGEPKCVQLTFNNLYASAITSDSFIQHNRSDLWLASLPFYHIGGFSIITRTIIYGCSLVIPNSLKEDDLYSSMLIYNPTLLSLVPTMLKRLISKNITPWENLRVIFVGGAPATEYLIKEALEKLWPIATVYGSTETASMVTVGSTRNLKLNGLSAGNPLEGVEVCFADSESDNTKIGQIVISSKSVAHSYLNLSKDENSLIKDGRYFSNDLGRIDSSGNLHIIGRKDDIIISGGENISLTEIENLVNEESGITGCIVLGVVDEKWGQSYVMITESNEDNVEEILQQFLTKRLAKFKQPKNIFRLKKIPRNEMGKIQKNKIKELINSDFL